MHWGAGYGVGKEQHTCVQLQHPHRALGQRLSWKTTRETKYSNPATRKWRWVDCQLTCSKAQMTTQRTNACLVKQSVGCSASMDEDDEYNSDEDENEEDRELMIECGQRQGRWERWEERCREALASCSTQPQHAAGLSHEEASAKRQQIFNPREAFMMLSKELLDLIKKQSLDMFVDSVGDDVYTWAVELASFDPDSALHKDMQEIQRRHQVSFVKLIISFKRGLHPFYPPSVEVVRPHFKGCTSTAVASHPLLKLGTWHPWKPVGELIGQIKLFLQVVCTWFRCDALPWAVFS